MPIHVVRLGTPRLTDEGLRVGTVRHLPRGVRKEDYARKDYFDVWLPELAPTAPLVKYAMSTPMTPARWRSFARRYRAEMARPPARHVIAMLAELSKQTSLSVGCYCEDESHCHRSVLRELLREAGATVV